MSLQKHNPPLRQFLRTDMAAELYRSAQQEHPEQFNRTSELPGSGEIAYSVHHAGSVRYEKLVIADDRASEMLGKSIGTYYTVHTGDLRLQSPDGFYDCRAALRAVLLEAVGQLIPDFRVPGANGTPDTRGADRGFSDGTVLRAELDAPGTAAWDRLAVSPEWDQGGHLYNVPPAYLQKSSASPRENDTADPMCDPDLSCVTDIPPVPYSEEPEPLRPMTLLVVGLGNPGLTPDALGPLCVRRLNVTRHLPDSILPSDTVHRLCAVTPLVIGVTGIETLELVRGAVEATAPDLVILVDALAASETGTLTRTVQVSTTGIHPGGGVGNKRQPLDADTLGVPVLTVGVPTVIAASTLIYRALEAAGILPDPAEDTSPLADSLHKTLSEADSGHVTPKDVDAAVNEFAHLIALCINELALGTALAEEWFGRI